MGYIPVTRSQIAMNPSLLVPPLVKIQARSSREGILAQIQAPMQMEIPPCNFVIWNSGRPLIPLVSPTQWDLILASSLKDFPKFIGEYSKIPIEHLQDVANVFTIHNVTQ